MKIKMLRVTVAQIRLKNEQAWTYDENPAEGQEPHTTIRMLPCGHFVVRRFGVNAIISGAQVVQCEAFDPEPLKGDKTKA